MAMSCKSEEQNSMTVTLTAALHAIDNQKDPANKFGETTENKHGNSTIVLANIPRKAGVVVGIVAVV